MFAAMFVFSVHVGVCPPRRAAACSVRWRVGIGKGVVWYNRELRSQA